MVRLALLLSVLSPSAPAAVEPFCARAIELLAAEPGIYGGRPGDSLGNVRRALLVLHELPLPLTTVLFIRPNEGPGRKIVAERWRPSPATGATTQSLGNHTVLLLAYDAGYIVDFDLGTGAELTPAHAYFDRMFPTAQDRLAVGEMTSAAFMKAYPVRAPSDRSPLGIGDLSRWWSYSALVRYEPAAQWLRTITTRKPSGSATVVPTESQ